MIPSTFDYRRAGSLDEALELLQQNSGDAQILAGGHSLLPAMKLRLSSPSLLIDIGGLSELGEIGDHAGGVSVGAGATHHSIESSALIQERAPLLAQAAATIGDMQVRNVGTIGGSLAHADPAADYPAALLAVDAELVVRRAGGERTIAAADFFVDLFMTGLEEDELIVTINIPAPKSSTGARYLKFSHPASRFAVCGCAAAVTVEGGKCSDVRIGFTGLANAAFRDTGVEDALRGGGVDEASVAAAADKAAEGQDLLSDSFAGEDYRRQLARVYAKRAILEAAAAA